MVGQSSQWMDVFPGAEQPFDFSTQGKMRHRVSWEGLFGVCGYGGCGYVVLPPSGGYGYSPDGCGYCNVGGGRSNFTILLAYLSMYWKLHLL